MPIPRICTIPDCGKPLRCRGYCEAHYRRWLDHGDPLAGRAFAGQAETFLRDTAIHHESEACLIWPFGKDSAGYGRIVIEGRAHAVHRLVCEEVHGVPPSPEHEAAHNCGNPPCCNWKHLRWATPAENKADELIHGTRRIGEEHGCSKVAAEQIISIRSLASTSQLTQTQIGDIFGLSQSQVSNIVRRKQWAHV